MCAFYTHAATVVDGIWVTATCQGLKLLPRWFTWSHYRLRVLGIDAQFYFVEDGIGILLL